MIRVRLSHQPRHSLIRATTLAASLLVIACGTAAAGDPDSPSVQTPLPAAADPGRIATNRWLSVGVLGGFTLPDPALGDYQWQVTPHGGWGAETLVGRGPWAGGLRAWTTATEQEIGAPGAPATTRASTTTWELVGRVTVAQVRDVSIAAGVSAGRIRLAYSPDRVTVATGGGPIEVAFAPVNEWVGGAGLALQRPFGPRWGAAFQLEHRVFALDTAHRAGDVIVQERSTFGDWSARFALARRTHW